MDPIRLRGAFNGRSVSKWFVYYRTYKQSFAKLNASGFKYVEEDGIKGIWITLHGSMLKPDYDLVIFYIHGGGFVHGSPWFYVEFLNASLMILQQQGFKNPAIFIVDYQQGDFSQDLHALSEAWQFIAGKAPKAHLALTGDGSGGLLALALLFHISSPYNFIPIPVTELQNPSALVLISPWTKLYYEEKTYPCTGEDFFDYEVLNKMSKEYIGEEEFNRLRDQIMEFKDFEQASSDSDTYSNSFELGIDYYKNPNYCISKTIWQKAFPKYGAFITYGDEEYLREEITELAEKLSVGGKTKYEPQLNQIHDWLVLTFYTERIEELREDGIYYMCGVLSRMLLWNTETFFERGALVPSRTDYR